MLRREQETHCPGKALRPVGNARREKEVQVANGSIATANSTPLERDARLVNTRGHHIRPGEVAIGVIVGRTSEFFDFFVFAIASVLVFPTLAFGFADRLTGTLYSFGMFALAFAARPFGTLLFMWVDRNYGRGTKLTIALFLLGGSTIAMAFLPAYTQIGMASPALLGLFRIGQGLAWGGAWDGLPSLLALDAPRNRRGWYTMIPQLGAPLGLLVAAGLFAFFRSTLTPQDFIDWGWRYPFFVVFAINAVALFARLRIVATPAFERAFESRELQPSPAFSTMFAEWRTIVLGAFAPLASFALFHLVTVFPLSWVTVESGEDGTRFLLIEMAAAVVGLVAIVASGLLADRVGRRMVLGVSAILIGAYSGFAPQLLDAGAAGQIAYMFGGFALLGLAFGQSSGVVNDRFPTHHRYTGAAIVANAAWFIGAGFAPLVALLLAVHVGLWAVGAYLLSGVLCTLAALAINTEWAKPVE
ncbi:MAG: MFS transporter [Proteobacteria bacterium]|nr:MFS transporter [Pseudomonadota bacterium]